MSRRELVTAALLGAAAATAAKAAYAGLSRRPPGGQKAWTRVNHRGETVTLAEGPALAIGAIAPVLAATAAGALPARDGIAMAVAGAGGAAFGALDDLAGSSSRRGLRGHLGALRHGEVTTGAVKLVGIGATGLASAALAGGVAALAGGVPAGPAGPADIVINAGLIAGGANLLNLFDLRPGRAIKVAIVSAALIEADAPGAAVLLAAPVGASAALLPEDLAERAMLGDAGANALGAMLGAAAARALPRPGRVALLAGIVALTVASEKISFTKVIERTPLLRWLDMLGRRPASPPLVPAQREHSEDGGLAAGRSEAPSPDL